MKEKKRESETTTIRRVTFLREATRRPCCLTLSTEELAAPGEMEPAVVLRVSLKAIANVVADKVGKKDANLIFHDRDDAMSFQVDDVPLVFVSFNEEPREVHVHVADRNVQGEGGLLELLGRLPLSGVEGDWWTREDQPRWPGNRAVTFVIRHRGRGRRLWI